MILRYILQSRAFHGFDSMGPVVGHGRRGGRHRGEHDHERDMAAPFAAFGTFGRGRGRRGGGLGSGRKVGAADLQLLLLSLLAEEPRHGYELIKALEERTGGYYVPSPGMIYPALTYLEDLGFATVASEGARKRYSVTPEGNVHLEANRAIVDAIFAEFDRIRPKMEEFRSVVEDDGLEDAGAAFHAARHAIRRAIAQKRGGSPQEFVRIARILDRAAKEIAGDS